LLRYTYLSITCFPNPMPSFIFTLLLFFHFFDVPRPSMHSTLFYAFGPLCLCVSLRSHLRKTTQPSTRNDTAVKTLHPSPTDANHTQQKRVSHTKIEGEPTNRGTCQQPLSPPETPGPETLRPTTAHLQPAGLPTVAEDSCLFESLLESALAALVAVRSTPIPNPTSILSQTAKNTLAKLNKLVNAATPEASNDPNAQLSLNSQGVQTVSTYADITKTGQAEPRKAHTKRRSPPTNPPRPPPQ
jgi:hypothetical protein